MKVKDLQGKRHSWNLTGYVPKGTDSRPRSNPHIRARHLLKDEFPTDSILEEVPLPGTKLLCDFFLPIHRLMIEVQGRQHFEFVKHFHGTMKGFLEAKQRDAVKAEWCAINNITLIELRDDDDDDRWREIIRAA